MKTEQNKLIIIINKLKSIIDKCTDQFDHCGFMPCMITTEFFLFNKLWKQNKKKTTNYTWHFKRSFIRSNRVSRLFFNVTPHYRLIVVVVIDTNMEIFNDTHSGG